MQFKLVALLTLVAASVNGAVLNKRSREFGVLSPTGSCDSKIRF